MRVVWILAVLLSVLAPAGHVGITMAPTDTEQVTTPRPVASGVARRAASDLDLQDQDLLALPTVRIARVEPAAEHVTMLPSATYGRLARPSLDAASPRAPPA